MRNPMKKKIDLFNLFDLTDSFGIGSKNRGVADFFPDERRKTDEISDTFQALTKTIEEFVDCLPSITIPSSVIGANKKAIAKTILKELKRQNLTKVSMMTCSIANLISKHSGAKKFSMFAGFIQNCMALYAVGDAICGHINFSWDFMDSIYLMMNDAMPNVVGIDLQTFRDYSKKYDNDNSVEYAASAASLIALVKVMNVSRNTTIKWFSANDQTEHEIEPILTNLKSCKHLGSRNNEHENDDDDGSRIPLVCEFENDMTVEEAQGKTSSSDQRNNRSIGGVYVFRMDNVKVYLTNNIYVNEDADSGDQYFCPHRTLKGFWLPIDPKLELTAKEIKNINDNIEGYIEMLFAQSLETDRYMYNFDEDGELLEMVRPVAIPKEFVSKAIPKIIEAIQKMHDVCISRSFALVGNPGTGKTIGAQQISNAFPDVCTFKINADTVISPDTTETLIRYVKAVGRCIIIMDDMDSYNLSDKNETVLKFLSFFDKLNQVSKNDRVSYVFIATINDPSRVNSTIMTRSGRIDEMDEIGCPDFNAIKYLFEYNFKSVIPDRIPDLDSDEFVEVLKLASESNLSAADIPNIIGDIVIYNGSDDKITPDMITGAINRIKERNQMSTKNYLDKTRNAG